MVLFLVHEQRLHGSPCGPERLEVPASVAPPPEKVPRLQGLTCKQTFSQKKENMTSTWRPTLTVKEAIAICGSLSEPSKMPGHGYALPANRCRLGLFLQQLPKAICHYCYALRGRYVFPRVQ